MRVYFVNKYLPSLQLQKHWICVFIFEINIYDPHTTQPANFHAYTIPKLAYCPVKNVSKFIVYLTHILHIKFSKHFWRILHYDPHTADKIFKTFLKNSVLKYKIQFLKSKFIVHLAHILHKIFKTFLKNSVSYTWSSNEASPRASPPSFPRICTNYS